MGVRKLNSLPVTYAYNMADLHRKRKHAFPNIQGRGYDTVIRCSNISPIFPGFKMVGTV